MTGRGRERICTAGVGRDGGGRASRGVKPLAEWGISPVVITTDAGARRVERSVAALAANRREAVQRGLMGQTRCNSGAGGAGRACWQKRAMAQEVGKLAPPKKETGRDSTGAHAIEQPASLSWRNYQHVLRHQSKPSPFRCRPRGQNLFLVHLTHCVTVQSEARSNLS